MEAKAVGRVEGARAVGRAQRGGHRSGFGRAAKLAALAAVACAAQHGVLGRRGPAVRLADRGHARRPRTCASSGPGPCIAALVVGVIIWGLMFWAMIFHRKRAGESDVPPRQTQYNLPIEIIFTVVPTIIVAVLFAFTVQVQNNVVAEDRDAGRQGRHHRVQVELALRLPGHADARRAPRSPRSARPTRSRCWCCRRTSRSSSPSAATTSSTASGCRTSCSSATSSRCRRRTTRSNVWRITRSTARAPSSAGARSCAAPTTRR